MLAPIAASTLKRDRVIVAAGLVATGAIAWAYMIHLASTMLSGPQMSMGMSGDMDMYMPTLQPWQFGDILLTFIMWAVMMIAMMTPSATPVTLMLARVDRQRHAGRSPLSTTSLFLSGYLSVWIAFSAVATVVQLGLHSAALLSSEMTTATPLVGGTLLVLAGAYQFTPLKRSCLSHCRTPLGFLMTEWRDGAGGAFIMGTRHGIYCVGCCWLLMALLFVAGVMNLLWVAVIAAFVLAEKVVPAGEWASRAIGLVAIGWGGWMFVRLAGS